VTFVDVDEMPILGEPLPVELANTLYGSGSTSVSTVDFLGSPELIRTWFALAFPSAGLPGQLRRADADAIRDLRDVINRLLRRHVDGRHPLADDVAALNDAAAAAPSFLRLDWTEPTEPTATTQHGGSAVDAALGRIAAETIALVTGHDRVLLRRCNGPGCTMLFVKAHHKRQWCHESCGHRARQASYYRRTRLRAPDGCPMVEGRSTLGS